MAYEIATDMTVPVQVEEGPTEGIPWWIWLVGLVVLAMATEEGK